MVIGLGPDGDRVEPGRGRFVVAQPGPGGGLVEDLHDLGAEAAGELPVPAEGVFPGDPALLVRGGAQRQIGLAEQPVVGDHAVPGRVNVGQAGPHPAVDRDRALTPRLAPAPAARSVSGRTPTTTSTMSAAPGHAAPSAGDRLDAQPPCCARRGLADGLHGGAGEHLHAVGGQFGVHQRAQFRVDGRAALRAAVPSGSRPEPRMVSASAISRPMYPAPTMIARRGEACSRVCMSAKVSPIECSRCTPSAGPRAPGPASPLIGGRTGTAPVPMISLS